MSPSDERPATIFLMGPTATGKTEHALALAEALPLEIVSVDSALVYRGLDVGTAKPDPAARDRVAHHLIDIVDPEAAYSAGRFRDDARAAMTAIRARGRVPLLVGGTMLYFRALTEGLAPMPPADPGVRAALEREAGQRGLALLYAELEAVDPLAAARIHPNDGQRIQRALEVHRLTGRPISAFQRRPAGPGHGGERVLRLALAPAERGRLHRRIGARFDAMLAQGLVEEVERLRARPGIHGGLPAMRAVGYRQVWRHLAGELGRGAMRERGIAATRQLAKRQLTWLRGTAGLEWLDSEAHPRAALRRRIETFLG